ncbi:MAG: flavodoxin family protein [Oscillospiraceae bacterium]|nr:flavodoxin family protein [Oscillospiraceae bacterium]
MKVLLINGSAHTKGCTYTALSECAAAMEAMGAETEIFQIGSNPVRGCIGCGACFEKGKCVFEDDCCNNLADRMAQADGIIVGSPVYYASASGALCALLDRVFYSASRRFTGKPAACIVSCRRGGASAAFDRLNKYFTINQMPVVSSMYWNSVHGFTPEDVRKDAEGLQVCRRLGQNMVHMLQSYEKAGIPAVPMEAKAFTSFADGK